MGANHAHRTLREKSLPACLPATSPCTVQADPPATVPPMREILTDLTTTGIIAASEANFSAYYLPYGTLPDGVVNTESDLIWFVSGIPEPWFNGVVGAHLRQAPEQRVAATLAALTAHNLPFLWHSGPTTPPPNLGALLHAHGLRQFADEPCMALDLRAISAPAALPAGFVTVPVREAEALTRWTGVWMATVPEPTRQRCRAVYEQLGVLPTAPWRYYLGLLDGVPVTVLCGRGCVGAARHDPARGATTRYRRGDRRPGATRGQHARLPARSVDRHPRRLRSLSAARVPRVRARGQPHLATSQRIDRHR